MEKEYVVVSLFDGMSCLQQAMERSGKKVIKYYASEIDKYGMQITQKNYPNTIQLGSVVDLNPELLGHVDFLGGGSPCQSFSFAGKRKGMAAKLKKEHGYTKTQWLEYRESGMDITWEEFLDLMNVDENAEAMAKEIIEIYTLEHYLQLKSEGYEFEGQSYLFWEYMRVLTELRKINPDIKFLLENVMMGQKWEKILTKAIGVNPICINATLVSAQNRERLWWTNIGLEPSGFFGDLESTIQQPKDREIYLKDILETEVDEKFFLSEKRINTMGLIQQSPGAYQISNQGKSIGKSIGKSHSLMARDYKGFGNQEMTGIVVHNTMPRSGDPTKGGTGHLSRTDGKTYCLDTGNTNAVEIIQGALKFGRTEEAKKKRKKNMANGFDSTPFADKEITGVDTDKMGALTTTCNRDNLLGEVVIPADLHRIRRLTPTECERLQCVKDGYTIGVSDTQRYRMLGNGWNVDVATHILTYLK